MDIVVKSRKWGNSLGIAIPKHIVKKEQIAVGDELIIKLEKKKDMQKIMALFGSLPKTKTAQQIKDEMRKGWE